jgi:hypothetical protein
MRRWIRISAGVFVTTLVAVGVIAYTSLLNPPTPLLANVWASSSGSDAGANCPRQAVAAVKPADSTTACSSLQQAYTNASPGDTIGLISGTWAASRQYVKRGSSPKASSLITYKCEVSQACAFPGGITLGSSSNTGDAQGSGPSNVAFDGITVPEATFNASGYISSYQLDNITLKNSRVHFNSAGTAAGAGACSGTCSGAAISFTDSKNVSLVNNDIGPICCALDGIRIQNGSGAGFANSADVLLSKNHIHDVYNTCTDEPAFVTAIVACSGYGIGDGCSGASCEHVDGMQMSGAAGLTLDSNRWYAAGNQTVFLQCFNSNAAYSNVLVQNDLVSNRGSAAGGGAGWSIGASCGGGTKVTGFVHFYYTTIQGVLSLYGNSPNDNGVDPAIDYKLVGNIIGTLSTVGGSDGCSVKDSSGANFTPTYSKNLIGNTTCGDSTTGTATFVSGTNSPYDLRLSGAQAAVDGGESTFCPATDWEAQLRPLGSTCDIGGDETS